jgi:hypothetical protein
MVSSLASVRLLVPAARGRKAYAALAGAWKADLRRRMALHLSPAINQP